MNPLYSFQILAEEPKSVGVRDGSVSSPQETELGFWREWLPGEKGTQLYMGLRW